MEFTIHKSEFVKAIQRTVGVSDSKSPMAILGSVCLVASPKSGLQVTATDLTVGISGTYSADVKRPGGVTIPAKGFFDIVKNLPEDVVLVRVAENNRVVIKSGKTEYKISGDSADSFPKLPDTSGVGFSSLDSQTFGDMISKTFFSVSQDETRAHLNGVYLISKGDSLRMVSTDGHRLSVVSRPLSTTGLDVNAGVIVPRKGLLEVKRILDKANTSPVEIGISGSNCYLRRGELTLSIKLIDAQFPDYEQVIPKDTKRCATICRQQFADALKRIDLLSNDVAGGVKLSLTKNALQISIDNQSGEAHEDLDVEYTGQPLTFGINARYALDVLTNTEDIEVNLSVQDEISPVVISPVDDKDYTCVIIPMRI